MHQTKAYSLWNNLVTGLNVNIFTNFELSDVSKNSFCCSSELHYLSILNETTTQVRSSFHLFLNIGNFDSKTSPYLMKSIKMYIDCLLLLLHNYSLILYNWLLFLKIPITERRPVPWPLLSANRSPIIRRLLGVSYYWTVHVCSDLFFLQFLAFTILTSVMMNYIPIHITL